MLRRQPSQNTNNLLVLSRQLTTQTESVSQNLLYLLKQCRTTKQLKQLQTQLLIHSIQKPNHILSQSILLKDFPYSSLLFSRLVPHPDNYAFNVMLRGLATTWQNYHLALNYYYKMKQFGITPNNFTYPFLFIACGATGGINHGKGAHSSVFKLGLDRDGYIRHSLITMYAKCGELRDARRVFDGIAESERDTVSWNSMISGCVKAGFARDAVELFGRMREGGFVPDEMSLVSVLSACGDLGDVGLGRWVEGYIAENRVVVNSYVGSALIDMYGKCGELRDARRVFDGLVIRDRVTWNAMITGYAQNGMSDEAIVLFTAMKEAGVGPDTITLIEVLSACASIGALDVGKSIDLYASQKGLHENVYVATALIDMYAKCGSLDNALRVFGSTPEKNEVSWNAMISGLAFHGQPQEALSLFESMLNEGRASRPNDITFVAVLSACVHGGLVDKGQQLFEMMSSSFGLVPKVEHYSCMVDLLSRAGHIYEAWNFVEKMPEKPDEVTLGALLGACHKQRNADVSERVMQLLLEKEPSNSGNYVISSKIYANLKQWDEAAKMRVLMRQRGVTKTPGCSWVEIEAQLHEFHAGDKLQHDCVWIFKLLIEELMREGYVPRADLL